MGNQAGVKELAIGTKNDLNDDDQGTKNGTTKKIYGAGIPPKKTTKERPNFLMEVQAKVYYDLEMIAKKFRKNTKEEWQGWQPRRRGMTM